MPKESTMLMISGSTPTQTWRVLVAHQRQLYANTSEFRLNGSLPKSHLPFDFISDLSGHYLPRPSRSFVLPMLRRQKCQQGRLLYTTQSWLGILISNKLASSFFPRLIRISIYLSPLFINFVGLSKSESELPTNSPKLTCSTPSTSTLTCRVNTSRKILTPSSALRHVAGGLSVHNLKILFIIPKDAVSFPPLFHVSKAASHLKTHCSIVLLPPHTLLPRISSASAFQNFKTYWQYKPYYMCNVKINPTFACLFRSLRLSCFGSIILF